MRETVAGYLARGGQITYCQPRPYFKRPKGIREAIWLAGKCKRWLTARGHYDYAR